jgi:hypothetical protein
MGARGPRPDAAPAQLMWLSAPDRSRAVTGEPVSHWRRAAARSASTSPPQMPCRPMVRQCRSESSRHSARTGHTAHIASAWRASARAPSSVAVTGNQSSGSIAARAHLASGLITQAVSCPSESSAGSVRGRRETARSMRRRTRGGLVIGLSSFRRSPSRRARPDWPGGRDRGLCGVAGIDEQSRAFPHHHSRTSPKRVVSLRAAARRPASCADALTRCAAGDLPPTRLRDVAMVVPVQLGEEVLAQVRTGGVADEIRL